MPKHAKEPAHSVPKMSKIVNRYTFGTLVALGIAFLAFQASETTMEDIGEKIALKLLDMIPRKTRDTHHQAQPEHQNQSVPNPTRVPETRDETEEETLVSKSSRFDPVSYYNPRTAMDNRYQGLKEVCKKYSDFMAPERLITQVHPTSHSDMLVHTQSDISFCPLPRIASKAFEALFVRTRGTEKKDDVKREHLRTMFPKSFGDTRKAIAVRHPLERLLSVYRFHFGEQIDGMTDTKVEAKMSWVDFVYIVLEGAAQYADILEEHGVSPGDSVAIDTSMIDGTGTSKAWNPYWRQCGICHPHFMPHYIIHLEHAKEDTKVLLDLMDNPKEVSRWNDSNWPLTSGSPEVEQHFWPQLTKSEIRRLHEKYRVDHELFGFSPEYYINLGQEDEEVEEGGGDGEDQQQQ